MRRAIFIDRAPGGRHQGNGTGLRPSVGGGKGHHPIGQPTERGADRQIDAAMHQHAAAERQQRGENFKSESAETMRDEHARNPHRKHQWERLKDVDRVRHLAEPAQRPGVENAGHSSRIAHRGQQKRQQKHDDRAVGHAGETGRNDHRDHADQGGVLFPNFPEQPLAVGTVGENAGREFR